MIAESEFYDMVYEKMFNRLKSYVVRTCWDVELAEDILQEVFEEAYRNVGKLMVHENWQGWMYLTAKNKLMKYNDKIAKIRAREVAIDSVEDQLIVEPDFLNSEGEALSDLIPHKELKYLKLHYLEGYTLKEIADMNGTTEGALKMRFCRLKKKILEWDKEFS